MKHSTKLKNQLKTCSKWAEFSRKKNINEGDDIGLLYMQTAIEQIIKYLEMTCKSK